MTNSIAVGGLLVLSVLIRLSNLGAPLVEDHAFRQTQTAITVWTFVTEGIRPLAYQTPVFGPPWRVPLEFPSFQIAAALLAKAGVSNLDVACRLTNLLFFYLSAGILYGLCRMHFEPTSTSVCILLAYVWLPFTIFWSRTSMIDYASVAFALAYLYYTSRWRVLLAAIASGCLAYLTKITTIPIVAVALAWTVWRWVGNEAGGFGLPAVWNLLARRSALLAGLIAALVIPFVAGAWWSAYADSVRAASPATRWLTVRNLGAWNFGTWEQRCSWDYWQRIFKYLRESFAPSLFVVLPLLGVWRAVRTAKRDAFALTMVIGAASAVVIFFNLYWRHNYYLMAASPAMAIVAGLGLHWSTELVPRPMGRWIVSLLVLTALLWRARSYLAWPLMRLRSDNQVVVVGQAIREVTTPDELVVIEGHDWSSDFLYYARRKGLMWRGSVEEMDPEALRRLLKTNNFTTLVCLNDRSVAAQFWSQHRLVRQLGPYSIYKVSG